MFFSIQGHISHSSLGCMWEFGYHRNIVALHQCHRYKRSRRTSFSFHMAEKKQEKAGGVLLNHIGLYRLQEVELILRQYTRRQKIS